jgi:Kef-type K+ transport system membrane component KefB
MDKCGSAETHPSHTPDPSRATLIQSFVSKRTSLGRNEIFHYQKKCDMTAPQLSIWFFIQMFFILLICHTTGWLANRYFGQPKVVGEMIAGVFLGPSLFGLLFPELQQLLFPRDSLKTLYVGAQLGVGIYMFLVGLDFRTDLFRTRARSAVSISVAGIVVPFGLSIMLAPWLLGIPGLFSAKATLLEATLFLGASISITAFPMLARIIYEKKLSGTPLGTLALAAGAIDDMAAWCILAIVLASFGAGPETAVRAIAGGIAYAVVVLTVGRWLLAKLGNIADLEGGVSNEILAAVLALFMLAAWVTDAIGIHAVFGGFLLGIAMPRGTLSQGLQKKLEPFAVVFLVPMFFTFSGLNTQLNIMVGDGYLLFVASVILLASVLGKGVSCWLAARLTGESNRTALSVGALMNSRGLMELIILNIGLQKGIIQPALFSMFVVMAIITTLMASPFLERFLRKPTEVHSEKVNPILLRGESKA